MPRMPSGRVHGVRLNQRQDERCRSAIKTTEILQRMNAFVTRKPWPPTDSPDAKPVEMTRDQINAAGILLRKTIPDLASVQHEGADGGPLVVQILRYDEVKSNG